MSEKEWTIGNIIALAERFGTCIHRNLQAAYYHGEIDIREREKKEANENEIEARTELEQAVSDILDERDKLRAENERLQQRIVELEEALAKIASYESMRFKLSPYEYGLLEQIVGIAEHALRAGE
jgi:peptidoglycan hydrolase CwlO-like protein